jgi:hypothetical protein
MVSLAILIAGLAGYSQPIHDDLSQLYDTVFDAFKDDTILNLIPRITCEVKADGQEALERTIRQNFDHDAAEAFIEAQTNFIEMGRKIGALHTTLGRHLQEQPSLTAMMVKTRRYDELRKLLDHQDDSRRGLRITPSSHATDSDEDEIFAYPKSKVLSKDGRTDSVKSCDFLSPASQTLESTEDSHHPGTDQDIKATTPVKTDTDTSVGRYSTEALRCLRNSNLVQVSTQLFFTMRDLGLQPRQSHLQGADSRVRTFNICTNAPRKTKPDQQQQAEKKNTSRTNRNAGRGNGTVGRDSNSPVLGRSLLAIAAGANVNSSTPDAVTRDNDVPGYRSRLAGVRRRAEVIADNRSNHNK